MGYSYTPDAPYPLSQALQDETITNGAEPRKRLDETACVVKWDGSAGVSSIPPSVDAIPGRRIYGENGWESEGTKEDLQIITRGVDWELPKQMI